jgi:ATP-dependent Lon protease
MLTHSNKINVTTVAMQDASNPERTFVGTEQAVQRAAYDNASLSAADPVRGAWGEKEWAEYWQKEKVTEHKLFSATKLNSLIAERKRMNVPQDDKELTFLKKMQASGARRSFTQIAENYREIASALTADAPNFAGWIEDYLVPELALSCLMNNAFKITPTLFVGDAGSGKTRFCEMLAEAFAIPSIHRNLETEQSSSSIIGSARFWSNSKPGAIFDYYATGEVANPMFVFEELDKAAGAEEYSVMAAFYQILEPTSARKFCDLSTPDLPLDICPASWLFTANSTHTIPIPILSRLNVVHVPSLTPDQSRRIALKQFSAITRKLGTQATSLKLTGAALDALTSYSPRQQRMLLHFAVGRAIADNRSEIDVPASPSGCRQRLGFI